MQHAPFYVSSCSFYLIYLVVFSLHIASSVYYIAVLWLYRYIDVHPWLLRNAPYLEIHSLPYFSAVYGLCGSICVLHAFFAGRTLWKLIKSWIRVDSIKQEQRRPSKLILARLKAILCSDVFLEFTLVIQIALQTFQAYKVSHLISSRSINMLYVAMVVLHNWFMALLKVLASRQSAHIDIRFSFLISDMLLSVSAMAIPIVIFLPTYFDFDPVMVGFADEKYLMDTWQVSRAAENQQVFVTSFMDLVSKMAPGVSLLVTLSAILSMVKRQENLIIPRRLSSEKIRPVQLTSITHVKKSRPRSHWERVAPAFFIALGVVVLGLHLQAKTLAAISKDRGCLREMQPWLSHEYTCEVLEVSCTQKQLTGAIHEMDDALRHLRASTVRGLIFSHCTSLEIPPRIQTFTLLGVLKIYNSTIVSWERHAAVTDASHPALNQIYLMLTNTTAIPVGLLSPNFSRGTYAMVICGSNLTDLPPEAANAWKQLGVLVIEDTPSLTSVPVVLHYLPQVRILSFAGDGISQLPTELFTTRSFGRAYFAHNPIVELPRVTLPPSTLELLDVCETQMVEVPREWLDVTENSGSKLVIRAEDTPLCVAQDLQTFEGSRALVQCEHNTLNTHRICSLREEAEWRSPNR